MAGSFLRKVSPQSSRLADTQVRKYKRGMICRHMTLTDIVEVAPGSQSTMETVLKSDKSGKTSRSPAFSYTP